MATMPNIAPPNHERRIFLGILILKSTGVHQMNAVRNILKISWIIKRTRD